MGSRLHIGLTTAVITAVDAETWGKGRGAPGVLCAKPIEAA